jgi:hypothetical protein
MASPRTSSAHGQGDIVVCHLNIAVAEDGSMCLRLYDTWTFEAETIRRCGFLQQSNGVWKWRGTPNTTQEATIHGIYSMIAAFAAPTPAIDSPAAVGQTK